MSPLFSYFGGQNSSVYRNILEYIENWISGHELLYFSTALTSSEYLEAWDIPENGLHDQSFLINKHLQKENLESVFDGRQNNQPNVGKLQEDYWQQ